MRNYLFIAGGVLLALVAVIWLGLQIKPTPFPTYTKDDKPLETMAMPAGLPAPVERFYRTVYGDRIPIIKTAVITGRAEMRPVGPLYLPARFRFIHEAGKGYRHYIEVTWFGLPILKINERYLDGKGLMELPFGTDQGEKIDQGANLGMWAEAIWFPSIYLSDPRVHWEPIDDVTAALVVPFKETQQRFVVRFNPDTGLIDWFESMRYHGANSEAKTLWLNHNLQWGERDGRPFAETGAAIWMDDGRPWAVFHVEDAAFNVDVAQYIRGKGE